MGKGFNNYMCKKFFHPASRDNLKRVWMAQQKDDAYKKKQEELRVQYEKEQDLYNNKAMLSKESKDKLSVNFMYEPPPGAKKEREKEENEPEYKFEWQRKYNAPREDYCKGNAEIQDQPFGILVRNVRCIKCRKWGHINTDKECPLYNQSVTSEIANEASDALALLRGMREDGLRMRKTALDAQQHVEIPRFKALTQEQEGENIDEAELQFLKGLSTKEKLKLLKKLEKLESNGVRKRNSSDSESEEIDDKSEKKKKKKSKKRKHQEKYSKKDTKKKKSSKRDIDLDESEDTDEDEEDKTKKEKKLQENKRRKESKSKLKKNYDKKQKKQKKSSSSNVDTDNSSDSESDSEEEKKKPKRREERRRRREYQSDESDISDKEDKRHRRNNKYEERKVGNGSYENEERRRERKIGSSRRRSRSRSRSPNNKHSSSAHR